MSAVAGAKVPNRPARVRRALRVGSLLALGLGLAALLLAAAAFLFLHTAPGTLATRFVLEQWGSRAAGGTLRLGTLDLALWRGEAAATGPSLRLEGVTVEAQRVEVAWRPGDGPRVRVLRPAVVVRDTGKPEAGRPPATGLAARPWGVLGGLGAAEVAEGRIELRDARGAPWLVVGRLDARMGEERGPRHVSVKAADARAGGENAPPLTFDAALAVDGDRVVVEQATFLSGASSVVLRGGLDRISPVTAAGWAHGVIDPSIAGAFAPGAELGGRVDADLRVEVKEGAVSGTLRAASHALTVQGIGPWDASGSGAFDGERLVLEAFEAAGLGGRLVAEGPLALRPGARTDVRLRAQGFDVAVLAATFAKEDVPVAARADATLRWTTTGWDVGAGRGTGDVVLRPAARAKRPGASPGIPLEGSSRLRIDGRSLALEGASLAARGARVAADARLLPDGAVSASWRATLPLASVNPLLEDLGAEARLTGAYTGTLAAEGDAAGPASGPAIAATLRSDDLAAHGRPHALEARVGYAAGRLELAPLVVRSGPGQATVAGSLPVLAGAGEWDLRGEVDSLELAPALALAGLEADGPATGTLRVEGPRDAPRVRTALEARLALAAEGGAGPIAITLAASGGRSRVEVDRLVAEAAGGRIEGSGRFDPETRTMEAKATATGLAWARLPRLPEPLRRLGGTLAAEVSLGGTPSAPTGELRATLAEATLDGSPLPPLALDARADGRRIELGARAGEATVARGEGPLEGDWPVRLEIDAAAVPAQAILDAFPAAREREATVAASGTLVVAVPLRDPGRVRYSAEALRASGTLRRLEWATEPFRVEGDREALSLGGLRLAAEPRVSARRRAAAGDAVAGGATLSASGRVALAPSASFDLAVEGRGSLGLLDAVVPGERSTGTATLRLRVAGTGEAPEVTGEASVDGTRGRFEGARWSDLRLRARFLGREAEVEELSLRLLDGSLSARGRLPLRALGAGEATRLVFEAKDVDLARLLDAELRQETGARFLVSVEGEVEAAAPALEAARGRGRVLRLESTSPEGTVGLDAPAAWRLETGRFGLDPLRLTGPLGTLEARAEARLAGGPAAGSATVAGPFDLRFLSPFVPETTLSGPAAVDVRASWGEEGLRLDGALKVENARLVLEELAFAASHLAGELRFTGDRVSLEASGRAGGDGTLRARGGMTLGPSFFGPAEVTLEAERVPLSYPEGFRGRAGGTVVLSGDPENAYIVSGDVALRQGYYTAEYDASTQSIGRLDWQLAALRGGTIGEKLALDVNVRLEDPLRIRNSRARLDVLGSFSASGTLAQPTATGQVSLREGGTLTLSRANVRVSQGLVELNGYPGGTPELDLQGATRVGGVGINVQARGRTDDLQLTLDSPDRPDLSQTDLVALLLTGRTASAAATQGGVIVAEELAAALGGALQKGVGQSILIDVSPDRSLLADDTDPTQRFNVGHRLSDNLVVMYSTALDGTEQRWILDFNPGGGRFRLRLIDEEDQSLSFEVTDRFSFDLWSRGLRGGGRREREVERLSAVRLEGELAVPEEDLRKAARLKVNRRYSALQREEAAERVRALLAERGWPGASVEAETARPDGRALELVLKVAPGPRVRFQWWGDPVPGKERKAAEKAWPAYASPDVAAAAVARAALVSLQARGRHAAKVTAEASAGVDGVEVRLGVEAGPGGGAVRVAFEGNEALDDATLAAALPAPGSRPFFEALSGRGSALTDPLRLAYARAGFVDARVLPPQAEVDAGTGAVTVTFRVRERRASPVARVVLPEEVAAAGAEGPAIATRAGEPFDVAAYVADRDAIGAWYRREGWLDARVTGFLDPGAEGVSVRFVARPGERPRVGEVRVRQEGHAREQVVRRAVTLKPGDLVRPRDLAESRERLAELGIFRSVEVRPEPRAGEPGLRDVLVSVATRPDVTLEYGLRYSTEGSGGAGTASSSPSGGKLQFAGGLELANPLGWGWKARGYTLVTSDRQTWGVNLDAATFFGLRLRSQVLLYEDDDQDIQVSALASDVKGVTFQQTRTLLKDLTERRWHDRLRLQWGYTFKDITYVENATKGIFLAGDRAFVSLALIGDTRDSLTDPARGAFWTATTEISRRSLGSDVDYVRLYGQAFFYVPLFGRRLVWAQGYRAGAVPGEDPLLLIENRFRAGGPTTVRGFEQNMVGPVTEEGDALGGQAVAVLNQELRFPLWKRLHGGVFWDAGNVWVLSGSFALGDLRQSVGAGLRLMFPFGPIRLEYAWVVNPRPGETKGRLVFGLGHAF